MILCTRHDGTGCLGTAVGPTLQEAQFYVKGITTSDAVRSPTRKRHKVTEL